MLLRMYYLESDFQDSLKPLSALSGEAEMFLEIPVRSTLGPKSFPPNVKLFSCLANYLYFTFLLEFSLEYF